MRASEKNDEASFFINNSNLQVVLYCKISFFLSLISSIPFFLVVLILGSINVVQTILLGVFVFVFSLAVTKLFENSIIKLVQKIVTTLQRHKRARAFILKNA